MHQKYSKSTAEATVTAVSSSARKPKMITLATSAGSMAMTTVSMIFWVVAPERMWGLGETARWLT